MDQNTTIKGRFPCQLQSSGWWSYTSGQEILLPMILIVIIIIMAIIKIVMIVITVTAVTVLITSTLQLLVGCVPMWHMHFMSKADGDARVWKMKPFMHMMQEAVPANQVGCIPTAHACLSCTIAYLLGASEQEVTC